MFDKDIKRLEEEKAKEKDPEARERLQMLLDTRKAERQAVISKVNKVIEGETDPAKQISILRFILIDLIVAALLIAWTFWIVPYLNR